MFQTRNKRDVFVAKFLAHTTLSATDYPSSLVNGELGIMAWDAANNKEVFLHGSTTATFALYPKIKIICKENGVIKSSNWIDGRYVKQYRGKVGFLAQEQIYHVGYNGSTGSVDTTAGTRQTMRIQYKGDKGMWSEQAMTKPYTTPYDATATQKEIAQNLTTQVNADPSATVYLETRNSGAAAAMATATAAVVTFGSDVVSLTGSTTSTDAEQTIGAVLRLGYLANSLDPYTGASLNGAANSGIGVTIPVYIVIANSSTDSTLTSSQVRVHTPFQFPSATLVDGTDAGIVTAGTDWGFSVKSIPMLFTLDTFPYFKQKFDLTFTNMGTTTLTKTQESKQGNGVSQLVMQDEWEQKAQQGALNSNVWPTPSIYNTTNAVSGTLYGTIVIEHSSVKNDTIEGMRAEPEQIIIYLANDTDTTTITTQWSTDGTQNKATGTILDNWMVTVPGAFPAQISLV